MTELLLIALGFFALAAAVHFVPVALFWAAIAFGAVTLALAVITWWGVTHGGP